MEEELLKVFDEYHHPIGVATRKEIHEKGLWHETFHCWLVGEHEGRNQLYFQLRSACKKDYPNLLDITAAGHLLENEEPIDGVRELEEELGLTVAIEDLEMLGIMTCRILSPHMLDCEFCHVYQYHFEGNWDSFHLQQEEVSGIYCADLEAAQQLFAGEVECMTMKGFEVTANGEKVVMEKVVTRSSFVQHEVGYMEKVIDRIQRVVARQEEV